MKKLIIATMGIFALGLGFVIGVGSYLRMSILNYVAEQKA